MEITTSEQIRAGLRKSFRSGSSAKASTVCYGYRLTSSGELIVYLTEAVIVFYIFERFEAGYSYGKISSALSDMEIVSPTGKATWSRETISKLLANEKYVGDVILGKTTGCRWRSSKVVRCRKSSPHEESSSSYHSPQTL